MPIDPVLLELARVLPADTFTKRHAEAEAEAELHDKALERIAEGSTRRAAMERIFPDRPYRTMLTRLREYEAAGLAGLIDRRAPMDHALKITDEVRGAIRTLALTHPTMVASSISEEVAKTTGVQVSSTRMREVLSEMGLSRTRGRPRGRSLPPSSVEVVEVVDLPLAGGELLMGVEDQLGAVSRLTRDLVESLEQLPASTGPVVDDREGRDERGRFTGAYNEPEERVDPEVGAKFSSVEHRRSQKDLQGMRLATSSFESLYRKNLALTLLPLSVETARWSSLSSWQGEHLGPLVGYPYMPATLDKHAREMKLSGAAEVLRQSTASFWMAAEERPVSRALVAYIDASTKPLWTHHFTRSTKVSATGRVMPAVSTVWLNSGAGTPLLYRDFSGHVSVPEQVSTFLDQLQEGLGEGMVSRLVVLDRESHAVWLFKELQATGWDFIIPLRKNVTGPNAQLTHEEWQPYGEEGDEAVDGTLVLKDSRKGEPDLTLRVVGRRRHRTGNVAWYATPTDKSDYPASTILDLYFARWPHQELVFRDGKGHVGLDVHHGYGKVKVTNVAVVNRLERLAVTLARVEEQLDGLDEVEERLRLELEDWKEAEEELRTGHDELQARVDRWVTSGQTGDERFAQVYQSLCSFRPWLAEAQQARSDAEQALRKCHQDLWKLEVRLASVREERASLEGRTTIFTVDTELDEIMLAYKMTFMNLCFRLMDDHLGKRMELDTLIRAVLTLPGELRRTSSTERVCIYRQERDPRTMALVEQACASLTALGLERKHGGLSRRRVFEVVDKPRAEVGGSGSA